MLSPGHGCDPRPIPLVWAKRLCLCGVPGPAPTRSPARPVLTVQGRPAHRLGSVDGRSQPLGAHTHPMETRWEMASTKRSGGLLLTAPASSSLRARCCSSRSHGEQSLRRPSCLILPGCAHEEDLSRGHLCSSFDIRGAFTQANGVPRLWLEAPHETVTGARTCKSVEGTPESRVLVLSRAGTEREGRSGWSQQAASSLPRLF